ncbi:MAG: prohibitin family protein [candidate division WOR-3 bacterium]
MVWRSKVWYHLNPEEAGTVFQKIGADYVEKIVRPAARTAIRNTTSKYQAIEIYAEKRQELETEIEKQLAEDFNKRGIVLEKVLLRNISLPAKVKNAIEAKLEAEQEAQKMEFVLLKEKKEAERKKNRSYWHCGSTTNNCSVPGWRPRSGIPFLEIP